MTAGTGRRARITPAVVALHRRLVGMGVRLEESGGRLRVEAPPGALDDELRSAIRRHRDALLALLQMGHAPAPAPAGSGDRRTMLADLHRHGVRVRLDGNVLAIPEDAPAELRDRIERHQAWIREVLARPYDHDRALAVTEQVLRRATAGLDEHAEIPEAARQALDDIDRAAVAEDELGLLAALARFESEVMAHA